MLERTMNQLDELMKTMNSEMKDLFKSFQNKSTKKTKIKIKKGSTILINGTLATLLNDAIVETINPEKLMS